MTTEQYAIGYETGYQDGWNAATEQPAKPAEQEPVAWRGYTITNGYTLHFHYGEAHRVASKIEPLYTAPQPAKREPLRAERVYEICRRTLPKSVAGLSFVPDWALPLAREIERAHGIGGGV